MNCDPFKEEEWIPLKAGYQDNPPHDQRGMYAEVPEPSVHTAILLEQVKRGSVSSPKSLEEVRNHHEANQSLKQDLVNRPLSRFPIIFIWHLLGEIWNSEYSVRLGEYSRFLFLR